MNLFLSTLETRNWNGPTQDAHVENFHRRLREERLNVRGRDLKSIDPD
jgi:hypothetical protein